MVGPSKILTVSYGTFSCTLEGFDDPFATMRGIAEYFRDLAAEDRYFGAEPPQPDAEMLHRIAEREIQKRVEARVEDGGVVLRQVEQDSTPQRQPEPTPAEVPRASEPQPERPAETESPAESVAAKLARIRAAAAHDIEADRDTYVEDAAAEEIHVGKPIELLFDDVVPEAEADAEAEAEAEAEEPQEEEAQERAEEAPEAEEEEAEPAAAVEEEAEPAAAEAEEASEAEAEEGETAEGGLADIVRGLAPSDEETAEETEEEAVTEPDRIAIARVVRMRRDQYEAAVETGEFNEEAEAASSEGAEAAEDEGVSGLPETLEEAADEEAETLEEEADEEAETLEEEAVAEEEKAEEAETEAATDAMAQSAEETEEAAEEGTDEAADAAVTSTLSPEDEAELLATLEKVHRESEAERRSEKEGRALLANEDIESDDNSVSRILQVTNSELEESEGSRRRSAIAHLKAAVAATRADRFLTRKTEEKESADELDRYRKDLARVVRPRRPVEGADKPVERRMPPLVLVSEQRVDTGKTEQPAENIAGGSVRPRRITAGNLALDNQSDTDAEPEGEANMFRDTRSFAQFAEEMGAVDLPDLLEAAAAYASFVEGHDHFSRPQIMNAVQSLRGDDQPFTREEGLRSFGLLLRRGRIIKVRRGQFRISDTTRFNPEARAAGE